MRWAWWDWSLSLGTLLPSVLWHCWLDVTKSIQPVKNWVMRCWHGYLSSARCKWFTYGPADTTASLASLKSRLVSLFWCRLTRLFWKKRPLNRCHIVILLLIFRLQDTSHRKFGCYFSKQLFLFSILFLQCVMFIVIRFTFSRNKFIWLVYCYN